MKYGAHIYVWTDRWSDERLHLLESARSLGLDFVELSVGDDVRFTPELTREQAQALGLELTVSPGGYWPPDCDVASYDPEERRKGLEWHRRQVEVAGELGAVAYAGALYGHPGNVDRSRPPERCRPAAAECLHQLAEYAGERNVRLVIEPMSRFRTHVLNTPEQAVRFLRAADHPNLRALLDTWHMVNEVRSYGDAVRTYGDRLWGIHACGSDRGAPGGGLVSWDELFAALARTGFDGHVALETYNTSVRGGRFALERGVFRDICPDGDEFVRSGLRFLRRKAKEHGCPE
ncbi:MAG: sugar phosphate isomerase/epimerase family protein [Planctomycetota bacterium]